MKHIQIAHIKVGAIPEANFGECIREALIIATKEWQNVILTHNGKKYRIFVNDLFATVSEDKGL